MKQARKLAIAFQRPLSVFYLNSPPDEVDIVAELRRLPGQSWRPVSAALAKQIKLAFDRREFAIALFEDMDEVPPTFPFKAKLSDNPEILAQKVRDFLDISFEDQIETEKSSIVRLWREALEGVGVMIFQIPSVDPEEMQGFAITNRPLPIVAYNSQTTYYRRVFTICHELGHILLDDNVLHEKEVMLAPSDFERERFCNMFAAALLVPELFLMNIKAVEEKGSSKYWTDREIGSLARDFGVSKSVMIRRLHNFNLVDEGQYESMVEEYDSYLPTESSDDRGGNAFTNRVVHIGGLLSRLAFRSYYNNALSIRDLSSLFNLKTSSLGGMEYEVFRQNYAFGE